MGTTYTQQHVKPQVLDAGDLRRILIKRTVPRAEEYRHSYGQNLDMVRIQNAIDAAGYGLMTELTDIETETMAIDPHLSSVLSKRFGAVSTADWDVTASQGWTGQDKVDADDIATAMRDAFNGIPYFGERIYDLAWANFDGRAALEIHWDFSPARRIRWMPAALEWVHPRRLSFDDKRRVQLINTMHQRGGFEPQGLALEDFPGKFVEWTPRLFREQPEREGLGPRCLYWSFFKRFSWRMRNKLTELFAIPWRLLTQDPQYSGIAPDMESAKEAADDLGQTTTAAFGKGVKVDVVSPGENSGALFQLTTTEVNAEMSKLVLGNTGTTDLDANRASSIIGKGEQDILFQRDGNGVSGRIQSALGRTFVLLNFGEAALPLAGKFQLRTQPQRDRAAELERVKTVVSMGVRVAESEVREVSGFRAPEPDEPYVEMASAGTDAMGAPLPPTMRVVDPKKPPPPPAAPPRLPPAGPAPPPAPDDLEAAGTAGAAERAETDLERGPDDPVLAQEVTIDTSEITGAEAAAPLPLPAAAPTPKADADGAEPNGTPEAIVERARAAAAPIFAAWGETILARLEGAETPDAIARALDEAQAAADVETFAEVLVRAQLHAAMLGALDSSWEQREGEPVEPASFAGAHGDELLALAPPPADGGGGPPIAGLPVGGPSQAEGFATMPFDKAVEAFKRRRVVSPEAYKKLEAEERARAFSVAKLANEAQVQRVKDVLAKSITEGKDLRSFKSDVADIAMKPPQAETVFRNGVMTSYGTGRREQMSDPLVMKLRPFWQIMGVDDARTRPSHKAAHKKVVRADDPFWQKATPPFGHNCFVAGTRVEGAFIGASRAVYAGQVVELTTAKGRRLTVTPNHPVLTSNGFVPAGALEVGDQLLTHSVEPGVALLGAGTEHDEEQKPARAEDVFGALAKTSVGLRAHAGPDDFHGDAFAFEGEIDVVGTYGELVLDVEAGPASDAPELILEATSATQVLDERSRARALGLEGVDRVTTSGPRAGELALDRAAVGARPLQVLRLGAAAQLQPAVDERALEPRAGDAALAGELLERGAGAVALDELVEVRKYEFRGHVFDFETLAGWLVADGIVSSNCRCRVVSRSQRDLERLGLQVVDGSSLDLPDEGFETKTALAAPAAAPGGGPPPAPPRPPPPPPAGGGSGGPPLPPRKPIPMVAPPSVATYEAAGVEAIDYTQGGLEQTQGRVFGATMPSIEGFENIFDAGPGRAVKLRKIETSEDGGRPSVSVSLEVSDASGVVAQIGRTFSKRKDELRVLHGHFVVSPAQQGKGVAAAITKSALASYAELGVTQVGLEAAKVGRYTWASFGWNWSPAFAASTVAPAFAKYLREQGATDRDVRVLLARAKGAPELSRLQWQGREIGRDFLLSDRISSWSGTLRLDDPNDGGLQWAKRRLGF